MKSLVSLAFVASVCLLGAPAANAAEERALYLDASQPREARVEDLLKRLTLEEKIALLHGDSKFTTAAVPRLGIPRRWMSDGPHGVREDIGPDTWNPAGRTDDFATCMPALVALAATWNPDTASAYGEVVGSEALHRGKHILLAPGLNIQRTPLCGRNFEYMGEDPFLTARMAVGYIRGVQSQKVAACAKHFAANNQEMDRGSINVEMDERTLRELYLPAFKAAVQEGGVWAVMGAYNKFRGQHCCENDYLLNKVLKGEWGFQGLVVSDWGGAHDTREAALYGLDLEMGTEKTYAQYYLSQPFLEGIRKGNYPAALLDDKARRNLRVMFATGVFDERPPGAFNTAEHQTKARAVAEEACVLLKNTDNALPLDLSQLKSLAVIGRNATTLQAHGGDSSGIKAFYEITPLEGLVRRAGGHVNITYSAGYGERDSDELLKQAVTAARQADAAVIIGGLDHGRFHDTEGTDRKDLQLPYAQDELIRRVLEVNPRTVVILLGGSPMELGPWLAQVPAVLLAWYPGMEGGNALARVLFGEVNPSGKLPFTFPKRLADSPAHALNAYPGKSGTVRYEEGLLVGYRWFDTKKVEPLFPFGYGLSYTKFEYSHLKLVKGEATNGAGARVEFELKNTGNRPGAEVAQVYVHQNQPSLLRPFKELKGFRKIFLKPGETRQVSIPLDGAAFAFYDPARGGWVIEKGTYTVLVGSSSQDIRLTGEMQQAEGSFEREGT